MNRGCDGAYKYTRISKIALNPPCEISENSREGRVEEGKCDRKERSRVVVLDGTLQYAYITYIDCTFGR